MISADYVIKSLLSACLYYVKYGRQASYKEEKVFNYLFVVVHAHIKQAPYHKTTLLAQVHGAS